MRNYLKIMGNLNRELEKIRASYKETVELLDAGIEKVTAAVEELSNNSIKCVNKYELPEAVDNLLLNVGYTYNGLKDTFKHFASGHKITSKSNMELLEANLILKIEALGLQESKAANEATIKKQEATICELTNEIDKLKNQSVWSFIRGKLISSR
jgi:predicted ribosome quality control (RQC) complex YloA/Tae2 family protein